jgi:hypothetical protein
VPTTLNRLVSGLPVVCKGWCRYCGRVRGGGSAVMVMIILLAMP